MATRQPSSSLSRSAWQSEIASSSVSGVLSAERGRETSTSRQGLCSVRCSFTARPITWLMTALSLWTPRCDMPCSSRARLASDLVPCTVLFGERMYFPVAGSLPRWCLIR